MPKLNQKPIMLFEKEKSFKKKDYSKRKNHAFRQYYYQLPEWRELRNKFFAEHPLCELCKNEDGIFTEAKDVHHKNSPFDEGLTQNQRMHLLMDENNLISLCRYHHGLVHYIQQKKGKNYFENNENEDNE